MIKGIHFGSQLFAWLFILIILSIKTQLMQYLERNLENVTTFLRNLAWILNIFCLSFFIFVSTKLLVFSLYLKITLFLFISISLVLRYSWNLSPEYLCPLLFNFFVSILHFFYFPLKTIKLLLLIFILFYIFFYFSLKTNFCYAFFWVTCWCRGLGDGSWKMGDGR